MPTISVTCVVYHEEGCIRRALDSVRGIADEIIVLHDGPCRDKTLDIAREYADQVLQTGKRAGSAELIRYIALERTRGDWILTIDADERLSPEMQAAIPDLVKDPDYDAYRFLWPYFDIDGNLLEKKCVRSRRSLFRKEKMFVISLPHNTGDTRGREKYLDLVHEHYFKKKGDEHKRVRLDITKNIPRSRQAGRILADGLHRLKTFNCDIHDTSLRPVRKLHFIRKHPFISLFCLPAYSFFFWFIYKKRILGGWNGLKHSLNLPLYNFFLCYHVIVYRYCKHD